MFDNNEGYIMTSETPYDYALWQSRLDLTNEQAAHALDVSTSMFATLKRNGKGRKLYAWAAYGIECAKGNTAL